MGWIEHRNGAVRAVVRTEEGKISRTFDSPAQAKVWIKSVEAGAKVKSSGGTVRQLFEIYFDRHASHTDSKKANGLRLSRWAKEPWTTKRVDTITPDDINAWVRRRMEQVQETSVAREMTLMSSAFTYAVKSLKWTDTNPCSGTVRLRSHVPRARALLTEAEISALRAAFTIDSDVALRSSTAKVGACFFLAMETGLRSGEILRLKPEHYDRVNRTLLVAATEAGGRKASRSGTSRSDPSRRVPLTMRAMEWLDKLIASRKAGQPYIVAMSDQQRDALFRKTRDMAGVENLTFHHSKHEACTRLSRLIDVIALSHAIGTKDIRLLRDTYYTNDAASIAALLPESLGL